MVFEVGIQPRLLDVHLLGIIFAGVWRNRISGLHNVCSGQRLPALFLVELLVVTVNFFTLLLQASDTVAFTHGLGCYSTHVWLFNR